MTFIIGKKIEMTQHFCEDGRVIPVTLVQIEPNIVTRVQKNEEQENMVSRGIRDRLASSCCTASRLASRRVENVL